MFTGIERYEGERGSVVVVVVVYFSIELFWILDFK